ncbi:MAG: hypothetical protein RLO52_02600 [Sandaracinaceae bacterium]|nr:MAG: hypothetical protein EVA89_10660 [Sandaracinaceae bacterium]
MKSPERWIRALLLVGLGALALAATGCATRVYARPASGAVYGTSSVAVYQAPPPRQTVAVRPAAPYGNAVWVEGHWQWNGGQYVWVDGYYVQQRPGYTFQQPRWVQQGGRYVYVQGGWAQGGRVVHHVRPAPRVRARTVVRQPRRGRVVVQPRRGPVVRQRTVVGPRGGSRTVVQGRRGGSVTVRQSPRGRTTVRRRPPARGRGVTVRARGGRGGGQRGGSVTVRPR